MQAAQGGNQVGGHGGAPRDAALTRLRFFLIGWVIIYHLDLSLHVSEVLPPLAPLFRHGYLGVDGFFLLSGFALWLGYGARPPRGFSGAVQFLRRRFAKIWPLHALALLALALLVGLAIAAGATIREPERFAPREFLLQLFMVNAWETTDRHAWNYPSWALSVEWAGYLAFPLLVLAVGRLPRVLLPALPLAGLLGLVLMSGWDETIGLNYTLDFGLLRFALEFLTGLGIGRLASGGMLPRPLLAVLLIGLPLGLWFAQDAAVVLALAALIPLLHRPEAAPATGRPDLLLRLGEASFGVYLCWVFIETGLVGLQRVMQPGPGGRVALMLVGFLASLVAGWLAWRFVEVPVQRWLLRRGAGRPVASGALPARQ
ncbi:acyltransferase [Belnapia sp. T6]|uniref:Acyltransferase n=1 Tax=Belnapia mucosa TaxID=2804532 RepID=A0ABS1V2L7_9PROT|nr:acyltransferase [Belnapia mucosa]MBL6455941.1 acyltransferase [Belnapia mucosa]